MVRRELKTFNEIISYLQKEKRKIHLLLGNGFSISYNSNIFSYNSLSRYLNNISDDITKKLFKIFETNDFEQVMQHLDLQIEVLRLFKADIQIIKKIKNVRSSIKYGLINAIKDLHPEHVFEIPSDKSKLCASFLGLFLQNKGQIFTTNYDLLLYWVLMRNKLTNSSDGFGYGDEDDDEWFPTEARDESSLKWGKFRDIQNIHYLHGALHLFDTGIDIIKEKYTEVQYLLENIENRMNNKEYPIFITAGKGFDKLTNISHNKYLSYCYDRLCLVEGSLVTFGFNFGGSDEHIIAAINKASKAQTSGSDKFAKLFSIYIGVYSDNDYDHILSIKDKFKCKVNMYDAKTVPLWNTYKSLNS